MNEFLKGAFALFAHSCNSRLRIPIFEKAIAMPVSPAVELLENMLLDHPVASENLKLPGGQKILHFEKAIPGGFVLVE